MVLDIRYTDAELVYTGTLFTEDGKGTEVEESREDFSLLERDNRMPLPWDVLHPWTLMYKSRHMEKQFGYQHAAAHRFTDAASAAFEVIADICVLWQKHSHSIVMDRQSFYNRWFLNLGLATLFNRMLPLLLRIFTTRTDYLRLRGPVIVAFRLTRCFIFICWVALAVVCGRVVPCFMARGSMLDTVVTGNIFVPFVSHMRWVHHLPLQLVSLFVTMLQVHPQLGMCSVYDEYATGRPWPQQGPLEEPLADDGTPTWDCGGSSANVPRAMQVFIARLFGRDAFTAAACRSCIATASLDDFGPCKELPNIFVNASTVISKLVGIASFQPDLPAPSKNACWAVSIYGTIVFTYVVSCALYSIELRHRLSYRDSLHSDPARRIKGKYPLVAHVVTQQVAMLYFVLVLTWLVLVHNSP